MEKTPEVHEKLDKIQSDISEIKVTLAVNTEQLKEHMRRSDLLEARVEQVNDELKPVQEHVAMLKGMAKLLGGASGLLAAWAAIRRLFP